LWAKKRLQIAFSASSFASLKLSGLGYGLQTRSGLTAEWFDSTYGAPLFLLSFFAFRPPTINMKFVAPVFRRKASLFCGVVPLVLLDCCSTLSLQTRDPSIVCSPVH